MRAAERSSSHPTGLSTRCIQPTGPATTTSQRIGVLQHDRLRDELAEEDVQVRDDGDGDQEAEPVWDPLAE